MACRSPRRGPPGNLDAFGVIDRYLLAFVIQKGQVAQLPGRQLEAGASIGAIVKRSVLVYQGVDIYRFEPVNFCASRRNRRRRSGEATKKKRGCLLDSSRDGHC